MTVEAIALKFASSSKRHNFPILTQSSFLAARNSHPPKICKSTPFRLTSKSAIYLEFGMQNNVEAIAMKFALQNL